MLNDKQLNFCKMVARGISQRKAYQKAYGYESKNDPTTISMCATAGCNLFKRPEVKQKIQELQRLSEERTALSIAYTKQEHFAKIDEIQEKCMETKNWLIALKAEELKGKIMGFYNPDKENNDSKQPIKVLIGRIEKELNKDVNNTTNDQT